MMHPINWIQLVLVGLLVVAVPCSAIEYDINISNYIDLPKYGDFQANYHRKVRQALLSIDAGDALNKESILALIKLLRTFS
jgi:hypothetical protein